MKRSGIASVWLVLALLAGTATRSAGAGRPWTESLSGVADTVLFLGADGALWRAPFDLSSREVLWTPRRDEHVVRLRVSPDGRHVAFISRIAEEDTSWIWIGGPEPPTSRGTFASVLPYRWNHLHFEPYEPTTADRNAHGARFLQVGSRRWVRSSNTLAWTPDARGVLFGYNDGVAMADIASPNAIQVSRALPMDLVVLDPAPMALVNAIVLREGLREGALSAPAQETPIQGMKSMNEAMLNPSLQGEAWYLLYPGMGSWRAFPSSGLDADKMWTASESAVWWVAGKVPHPSAGTIRSVRAHDPTPVVEVQGGDPIVWLGFDAPTRSLLWASGRAVRCKPEEGGAAAAVLLETRTPVTRVLPVNSDLYAVCTRDSVHLLETRSGSVRSRALGGADPTGAFSSPGGDVWLISNAGGGQGLQLARVDSSGSGPVEAVTTPPMKNVRWSATPRGTHLVVYDPGNKAPDTVQVFDTATRRWTETANPGINGWEEIPPP